MGDRISFGRIVKERRNELGLTQAELGRRVGCAAITVRKIEADSLRPSVQIAEHLAVTLNVPDEEQFAFVRLARAERDPTPIPTPSPSLDEIGQADLSGRAIRGYQLNDRIGVGSHGAVYRAVQPLIERDVAIKIILPKIANEPEFIRRFEAEAQVIARLEHPHIVPLYDYWREPNAAYLIMRYLRGGNLDEKLQTGSFDRNNALALLEQICAALHASHRAGVVHRDIKPANILLDEDDNAYLADFGIAKSMIDEKQSLMTQGEVIIGSPAYISPEQIRAEPVKPQTDIYSLGLVLFEILTGRKAFKGPTPVAYIQQHLNEPLPLLAEQNGLGAAVEDKKLVPSALDIVIGRATAKDPQNRYENVLNFLSDLRQAFVPDAKAGDLIGAKNGGSISTHVSALIDLPELENPYKGLRPFFEADADDFFGRDTLIEALLARMGDESDLSRFLAVIGPSGSGKSSVVRAGLLPTLRQGGLPGSEKWFFVEIIPGAHPWEEMEAALLRIAQNPPVSLLQQLQESERGLLRALRRILPPDETDEKPTELVMVIDQFEEIFTLIPDETLRCQFLESLVTAVLDPQSRLRLIITLRADFIDRPLQYVDFGDLVRQRAEFVLPLMPDELEQAIVGPTKGAGLDLEPGLAATIMDDIGDEPGTLPLLQYALTELFERRSGRLLTLSAYQESGGVLGALARRAEEIYSDLDEAAQAAAQQVFLRLVTLGEGVEDTRRRVLQGELWGLALSDEETGDQTTALVIESYVRYRLLTLDHDPVTRGSTVEVAHEALIREWQRLRTWLDDSRTDIRMQRLLALAASEWLMAGQDSGFLLHGTRLGQFEAWAKGSNIALTETERAFLESSLSARQARQVEEEDRRRRELETAQKLADSETRRAEERTKALKRLAWLTLGLAVLLLVAIGAAAFAISQGNQAQLNAARAEENFQTSERIRLAAQAQIALDRGEDVVLPALLALRSLSYDYSPEADAALLAALSRGFARQRFVGHTDAVVSAVFSSNNQFVLTSANDTTTRLWDIETGAEIRQYAGHTELVNMALFSSDAAFIVTGSADRTVRIWDKDSGEEIARLPEHESPVWALALSSDDASILTSDESGVAWLWDVQTSDQTQEFVGHDDLILFGAISPDGRYAATASIDRSARLWDTSTGEELQRFIGHASAVSSVRFSPDGRFLLTASYDNTARLWDVETGDELRRFIGHTNILQDTVFSPDGRHVLTASDDRTARLWDIETGEEIRQFLGHTAGVLSIAFSADGQHVLTGGVDQVARIWDVQFETEPRIYAPALRTPHGADIVLAGFSADNQRILTGYGNGAVALWDIPTGQLVEANRFESGGFVSELMVSPHEDYVLAASGDGTVRLWETGSNQEVLAFGDQTGPVWDAAFSPDNRAVVTGSDDGWVRLFEVETGTQKLQLAGHAGPVRSVAFSPDGEVILTGSDDHSARLWRAETGQEVRRFEGHTGPVRGVAFSPDGK